MNVVFINENTLGHASYLLPFVTHLEQHPELGIQPLLLNATPLPESLRAQADRTIPGLRRFGLDLHSTRWRRLVSRHVRRQLDELRRQHRVDAVVVNTQSIALALADLAPQLSLFVCLDATFAQLARSRWFAPNAVSRALLPVTLSPIRSRERDLFRHAHRLLAWSEPVRESLRQDYAISPERIAILPPSLEIPPQRDTRRPPHRRPQILFVGGDFRRKGGLVLSETFRMHFAGSCDLHLVTHSPIREEPGVFVHHGVQARSAEWQRRWEEADLFIFPSTLETFGIVLIEALAFQVPIISADVGAARSILDQGAAGTLLPEVTRPALAREIKAALADTALARARADRGRQRASDLFNLDTNTRQLATWLHAATHNHP